LATQNHDRVPGRVTNAQQLQLLIDSLTDHAIFMTDTNGFISTWNSGAEKIKGYSAEEVRGQHFSRFFTLEDQANGVPGRALELARTTGRFASEGWRVRKDGGRFWASTVLQPVRDGTGQLLGFAQITRDVTERMEAQRSLLESEKRFRLLVEGVIDYAICMLDPSGVVINWNAGAERLKGYSADEIVGQHFSRFYTREDRAAGLPARVLETAAHDGRFEAEGWRVRKDGSRFWSSVVVDPIRDESGALIGFAKVTRDITERMEAQQALHDSERQFRLLVAGVTDYAIYMLDPNGIVINWNAGAQRIKGYTADEIIGHHFSRFYIEQDRAAGVPARALHTAATEGRFEAENWRVRKDGTLFWAHVVIDPIRDENGRLVGFAKITRDVTDKRNAQIALEKAQAERAQMQKMEALGELTGGVAHDFNNLLMVIGGHMNRINALVPDDAKARRSLEAIEIATRRGQALTRQLLTFARRQPLSPEVTRLDERIGSLCDLITTSVGASVKILQSIAPETWPVKVDVSELELALLNLAINARDAMSDGGSISIISENVMLNGGDPAGLHGDFVALTIADAGCGIPPDILARVFDPFFTTKKGGKGSGLGLAQVYGFARQSGGTATIDSELGRGTRVTLYLPRATEEDAGAVTGKDAVPAGSGRVLLVEDNPDVSEASAVMLEQLGYAVQQVENAGAALAALEQQHFELMVSDIVMAGALNGYQLARLARERWPDLPVLLVTGYSEAAEAAAYEFTLLRKPYQLSELSRAAANLIALSRGRPDNLVTLAPHLASRRSRHERER
jgi:PAS domain S-box-containing protein